MANAESGVSLAGLQTKAQPAASAGPALRVIMALGKFHGVMAATTPTGCLMTTMRPLGQGDGNGFAIDALGFLGEEFDEGGAIGDFAARFGQGLALLGGHDLGQVFLVLHHQVEPFAQDGGAFLGGLLGPVLLGAFGGLDGLRVSAAPSFGTVPMTLSLTGLVTSMVLDAAHPFAVDVAFVLEQRLVLQYVAQGLGFADIHLRSPVWVGGLLAQGSQPTQTGQICGGCMPDRP